MGGICSGTLKSSASFVTILRAGSRHVPECVGEREWESGSSEGNVTTKSPIAHGHDWGACPPEYVACSELWDLHLKKKLL